MKKTHAIPKECGIGKKPRRPRREYGIGDFLSWLHSDGGLRRAVRRVQHEDQLLMKFDPKDKLVN